jgi:hypothetical protein
MHKTLKVSVFIFLFLSVFHLNAGTSLLISNAPGDPGNEKPDYGKLDNWAAHPFKHDPSDSIPSFLKDEKRDSGVDVFFLHPTTYTGKFYGWNARLADIEVNKTTDKGTILFQASVFNASCRVFAPRYRQAHLNAFFTRDTVAAKAALDFAYEDLKNAFQYYLDHWNHGRPIIIASHSQGTRHGIRLLKEFFDGKPLQKQLVCAYLVGYQIPKDAFANIPEGINPDATGCVVGWRTFRKGFIPPIVKKETGNSLCVNPVTWTTEKTWSPKALHKGLIARNFNMPVYPKSISVAIPDNANIIWVDLPGSLKRRFPVRNFHIADYNLFYLNIRENVRERIAAWKLKN